MRLSPRTLSAVLALVLAVSAFWLPADSTVTTIGSVSAAATAAGQDMAAPSDTTPQALWKRLQADEYRVNWNLWPGTERLYSGTEPHGMLLTTYANDVAYAALVAGRVKELPAGSIIVKENYMADSSFAAATVMVRVTGYNPEHQDWLFAKYDPQGGAEAFGRVPMCQACHATAESGAYLFTPVGE